MLKLSALKPYKNSTKRRKSVGRGLGSGHGTFSGRGAKGQLARSGASIPAGFEGGRMPLHRQIPKRRGFTSARPKAVAIDLATLEQEFNAGETVNPSTLFKKGLLRSKAEIVKIVGDGDLKKSLILEKVAATESAKAKIEKAGGKISN